MCVLVALPCLRSVGTGGRERDVRCRAWGLHSILFLRKNDKMSSKYSARKRKIVLEMKW